MIVIVMGVAGSGKTRVGAMLADALGCVFLDADSLHAPASVAAMRRGIPLEDLDRVPWLAAVHERLLEAYRAGQSLVVACSALKQSYRQVLADGIPVQWVYLKGPAELIRSRIQARTDHFMKADMLESQVAILEEPADAIVADISRPPAEIVEQILTRLQ